MDRILITGALGQIGSDLSKYLTDVYGADKVILSDIREGSNDSINKFEMLDVQDKKQIQHIIKKYNITKIFHLAAILSANGEKNPALCWDVNMNGLYNILELARTHPIKQIISPSSIAVFGPNTEKNNTPQNTILSPTTIYGVTKVAGELLSEYYIKKYNIDIRSVRYPGLISYTAEAGGGTTDYAVDIFYNAIKYKRYKSFLSADTILPMMYMPDAIKALIDLGNVPKDNLHYASYNINAFSFSVQDLANEIKKHIADFEIEYEIDYRQEIANSWPQTIDDSCAREDWNWNAEYNLSKMTTDMLYNLEKKLSKT